MENIDEKRIIFGSYFGFVVAELNQSRFTHAARRNNHQIVTIGNGFDEPCGFRHTITEILRFYLTCHDKRVHYFRHMMINFHKSNYLIRIMQIK